MNPLACATRITIERNFLRILSLSLALMVLLFLVKDFYEDTQPPFVLKSLPNGKKELIDLERLSIGESEIKQVIAILNDGYFSFSYQNWQQGLLHKKAFLSENLFDFDYAGRQKNDPFYKKNEQSVMFYPLKHTFVHMKDPFIVDVLMRRVVFQKEGSGHKSSEAQKIYRLTLKKVKASASNPYGLVLINRRVFDVTDKEDGAGEDKNTEDANTAKPINTTDKEADHA